MLTDTPKGFLILPLSIEHKSEINAEDVGPGPAPSPWITFCPTGLPSIITAFKTPSILATYELFLIKVGWTRW